MPRSTALTASPPPCSSARTRTTRASAPRAGSWGRNTGWNFCRGISGPCFRRARSGPGRWASICRNTAGAFSAKKSGIKNAKKSRVDPAFFSFRDNRLSVLVQQGREASAVAVLDEHVIDASFGVHPEFHDAQGSLLIDFLKTIFHIHHSFPFCGLCLGESPPGIALLSINSQYAWAFRPPGPAARCSTCCDAPAGTTPP